MNPSEFAAKYKMIFEKQKQEILQLHLQMGDAFQVKTEDLSDENDHASAIIEQGMQMSLRQRELQFLKKIDLSLQKIRLGTFGTCECCEEPIELSRLAVRPTAELCLNCKEIQETEEERSMQGRRARLVSIHVESQSA